MSVPDLMRWAAFYELEPFGPEIDNWRIAQLTQIVASFGGVQRSIDDFMPQVATAEAPDADTQSAQWSAWWSGRKAQEQKHRG